MNNADPVVLANRFVRRCRRCQKWITRKVDVLYFGSRQGISHLTDADCAAALPDWSGPSCVAGTPEFFIHCQRAGALFEAHPWTFAKTMPTMPHFWTLRTQWASDADFTYCVGVINALGDARRYRGSQYVKLTHGGYEYWTMIPPTMDPSLTGLINRAACEQPSLVEL